MSKKMNIGLVLAKAPAWSETFLHSKIAGLQRQGHEVRLFVANAGGEAPTGCKVFVAPPVDSARPLQQAVRMALRFIRLTATAFGPAMRLVRLERADGKSWSGALRIVYLNAHILQYGRKLHWLHFGFATMALERENTARAIGARQAVSMRGYDMTIYPLKFPGCYRKLWQTVDKVHVLSDYLLGLAHQHGLPDAKPAQKIPPALDTGRFIPEERAAFTGEKLRILTINRLNWVKGMEYALLAMHQLRQCGIPFHYTVVGDGPDWERLHFARRQLELTEVVSFRGRVPHETIPELLREHDIYLQPSIQEGFCNAVLEAQAAGLLCVVTGGSGLAENVLDGETGWVVARRSADAIAERLAAIAQLPAGVLDGIRRRAAYRARMDFSLPKQEQDFLNFYEAVLSRQG